MKKSATKLPYRWKLTLAVLLFVSIPSMLFGGLFFRSSYPKWIENAMDTYYSEMDNSALLLSRQLSGMESKLEYIANNATIQPMISRLEYLSLPLALDLITELQSTVSSITADSPDMSVRWYPLQSTKSYGAYCYQMEVLTREFDTDNPEDVELQQKIRGLPVGEILWAFRDVSRDVNNTGPIEKRLCLYAQMGNYQVPSCILEITIPITQYFSFSDAELIPDGIFAFGIPQTADSTNLIWDVISNLESAGDLLEQHQIHGDISGYYIVDTQIPNIQNGQVVFAFPESYVFSQIQNSITIFALAALIIGILLFYVVYVTFWLLTRQYELKNLKMEMEILQLRFNPHLLYNTLNALCYKTKNPSVRETIASLCNYYRIVLSNGYTMIQVKDELEMLREYFLIEQFAYSLEQVNIIFDADEEVLECYMIKHLLQPIVENALNHGIRPLGKGELRITVKKEQACILFQVADDGVGMASEKVAELLTPPQHGTTGGYGVYNVQQRIQAFYGSNYGLRIWSDISKGTTVTLKVPIKPRDYEQPN